MKTNKPKIHLLLSQFSNEGVNIIVKSDKFAPSKFPLHTHNFFEIELVLEGTGTQIINGNKYKMIPGMFYFLSPSDSHEVRYKSETIIVNLSFSHNILPENFEHLLTHKQNELVFYTHETDFELLSHLFNGALLESQEKPENFETALTNYLSLLLLAIARKAHFSLTSNTDNTPINQAISYIKLHFTENPRLESVAQYVDLTAAHLTTEIKKQTGLSYIEYLTKLKISYAKKLLKSNQHSITEIVFISGFNSICNFNRVFKQKTHLSPSQYRKKYLSSKIQ